MSEKVLSELKELIQNSDIKRTVFWVGAGIDIAAPTCLPSGKELTEFVLQRGFNDKNFDMLHKYKSHCDMLNAQCMYAKLDGIPRLETVIGVLQKFENQNGEKQIPSFLKGFAGFCDAEPNTVHFYLAQLLHKGATIVTTNYDLCIPKAYRQLFSEGYELLQRRQINKNIFEYYAEDEEVGKIYYIHGIADNITSLGYSLQNVMQSLTGEFFHIFKRKYQEDNWFFFLGYSGLDNLDVNLMLKSFKDSGVNSKAVCIVYPKADFTVEQKSLLENFKEQLSYKVYLDEFFAIYQDICSICISQNMKEEKDGWKKYFTSYPEMFYPYIQMALAYELGISCNTKLSQTNIQYVKPYMEEWYMTFYRSHLEIYNSYFKTLRSMFSKSFDKYHKIAPDLNANEICISTEEKIDWSVVTPINTTVKWMIKRYSMRQKLVSEEQLKKYFSDVSNLVEHKRYEDFLEIREYYVLELCLAMLIAMYMPDECEFKVENIIKKVSEEYSKVSMIDGVLNSERVYLNIKFVLLKKSGTLKEWVKYIGQVNNYCRLLKQLGRRDKLVKFWLS